MGTATLIARKLVNNDGSFFKKFSAVRAKLEDSLIGHKDLIATLVAKHVSGKRIDKYAELLDGLVAELTQNESVNEKDLVRLVGLEGKVVSGVASSSPGGFSDDTKSKAFMAAALQSALRCPICGGLLDPQKSVSYDHVIRARDGGGSNAENCQLSHPYCNQSVKN